MRYFALLFLFVLAACGGDPNAQVEPTSTPIPTAPAVAAPTYAVQRGDVSEMLEFSGRWQPRDQEALAFEVGGAVRRVDVRRGDTITAGTLLADLQIDSLEDQLATAQLNLESALASDESGAQSDVQSVEDAEFQLANSRLTLDNARANLPWPQLSSARASLDSAQQGVENAQRAYDDALSRPEAANAASAVDSAYQQLQSAQIQLRTSQASYYSNAQNFNSQQSQIKQSENDVLQRELALERARNGVGTTESDAVRSARLSIEQIEADIARSSLYAPSDGVVLEVTIAPGDSVTAYSTVITIGRSEPKEAIVSLAFSDAQRLSVGLVGICQVINQPDTAVQCIVRRLPLSAQDADQTTRVAATLPDVGDGQLIEIDMPLQVRENVLWLPPAAIRTFQSRTFVVLQTADGPRRVDVEIGLQTDERVEIISGLEAGDVVIGQ